MQNILGTALSKDVQEEIYSLFYPVEGLNCVYYGKVRNGKTYSATCDIIELLERGEIVYANWDIDFDDYDERSSFTRVLWKLFFRKKYFYKFKKENFHAFHPDEIDIAFLGKLVGVHLFIDEGQWIFNSHLKDQDPDKRKLILHGGHYCRTLNVITQRPVNIMKDIRSQVAIWYKCVKRFSFGSFILFQRWEYQDMKDDLPDEDMPVGRPKTYVGSQDVFRRYNTHGMRTDSAIEPVRAMEVYRLNWWSKVKLLGGMLVPRWAIHAQRGVKTPKNT
jgi:hypothetical protein